jgi:hypothetical protein
MSRDRYGRPTHTPRTHIATTHRCRGDNCPRCLRRIEAAEDERWGDPARDADMDDRAEWDVRGAW